MTATTTEFLILFALPIFIICVVIFQYLIKDTKGIIPPQPPSTMMDEYNYINSYIDRIEDNERYYVNTSISEIGIENFIKKWYPRHYNLAYPLVGKLYDKLLQKKYLVTSIRNNPAFYNSSSTI